MAAPTYELTGYGSEQRKRRFALPRFRLAGFGGGFGVIVVGLGLLLIGLGWNGMAGGGGEINGVPNLNAQLPWLLSGGILGLALVVFGAAMLVVNNARTDRARLESKLDELIATTSRTQSSASQATAVAPGQFVAGGTAYHTPTCRLVAGRDDTSVVSAADVEARGLRPCRVCNPA